MTRRNDLRQRIDALTDIGDIMGAMKNLSLIETRKLLRILGHQQRLLANIIEAAADFFQFHPQPPRTADTGLFLVIGSERGFCGSFNDGLIKAMAACGESARFLVVGKRLGAKLEGNPQVVAFVGGPGVTEEVEPVLVDLMTTLSREDFVAYEGLKVLCHQESGAVAAHSLLPIPVPPSASRYGMPPLLNLPPLGFLKELTEQYLFAAMHQLFYSSLMAENNIRLQHMEHAIKQIEDAVGESKLKYNALRQEEITEEIEIIVLGADLARENHAPP